MTEVTEEQRRRARSVVARWKRKQLELGSFDLLRDDAAVALVASHARSHHELLDLVRQRGHAYIDAGCPVGPSIHLACRDFAQAYAALGES